MFDYFSSPMRWCETRMGNEFIYSPYIVEFWNSITSLIFCFLAIYGLIMHRTTGLDNIPWLYLFSIGATSTLFHSTLSFIGQFLDELSIILLITYCLKFYYNISYGLYTLLSISLAGISWFYPHISPPILLVSGFFLILSTYLRVGNDESDYIWYSSMKIGIVGILTWLLDFVCFMNTHMWWHIIISFSAYYMLIFVLKQSSNNLILCDSLLPYLKLKKFKK